jgi:hypothetical protein
MCRVFGAGNSTMGNAPKSTTRTVKKIKSKRSVSLAPGCGVRTNDYSLTLAATSRR